MIVGVLTVGLINYGMLFLGIGSCFQKLVNVLIIIIVVDVDMKKYARNN